MGASATGGAMEALDAIRGGTILEAQTVGGEIRKIGRNCVAAVAALIALESVAPAATYTWTGGGGGDPNWSNPENWGGAAPADNETGVELIFPPLTGHYATNNDRSGLHLTSLSVTTQLSDGDYAFTGNAIGLSGQVTMDNPGSGSPNVVWQIPVVLNGDATVNTSGRQTQLQGAIDLDDSTLTLDSAGDVVLAGTVSGSGNLVKNGGSALTISGSNSYSGTTTANNGALYIASATAFGDGATGTVFNGGFLGFVPGGAFTTAEPFVFNGGDIVAYGTPTMMGQVALNTVIDVRPFTDDAILTINGVIGGDGGLNKIGPGLLILNAATNSYAGATAVGAGTLQLDAALSSTSSVTVDTGATLKGNGSSGGMIDVQGGGTVAPGASPGQLSSAGLTMATGAIFAEEIDGASPITQYDALAVSGPVSLNDATLAVTLGYAPSDGQQFTLIAQLQDVPVSGTFAGLPEGAVFQVSGTTFGITYNGGAGHDVVLLAGPPHTPTVTPTEPAPAQTATATPTASMMPTATVTGPPAQCTGDCDGNGMVAINELVIGVNIALGNLAISECPRFDANGDAGVTIPELIQAVANTLNGCAAASSISR